MANEKPEKFWLYKDIFNKFVNQRGEHRPCGVFRLGDRLFLSKPNLILSISLEKIKNKNSLGLNNPIEIYPYTGKDYAFLDDDNYYFDSKVKSEDLTNLLIKKNIFSYKITPYWEKIRPRIEEETTRHIHQEKMNAALLTLQQYTKRNGYPTEIRTEEHYSIVDKRQSIKPGNNNRQGASNTLYSDLASKETYELLSRMFNDPEVYFLKKKPFVLNGGSEKATDRLWEETITKIKDPTYSNAHLKFIDPDSYGGIELIACS